MKIFEVTGDDRFDTMMSDIVAGANPETFSENISHFAMLLKFSLQSGNNKDANAMQKELDNYDFHYEQYDPVTDVLTLSHNGKIVRF